MHGGATPTAEENPKQGRGDQDGNDNGQKHSLHSHRGMLYERLTDTKKAQVDELEASLINRYEEYHGREPDRADVRDCFEVAMGYVQRDFAREYMVEQAEESGNPLLEHVEMEKDGKTIEFDKPNALLEAIGDSRREDRLTRKHKGLEKDPDTQQAEAQKDMADLWKEGLERAQRTNGD